MALSNRYRVGKMFEVMAPALDDFISTVIGGAAGATTNWVDLCDPYKFPVAQVRSLARSPRRR